MYVINVQGRDVKLVYNKLQICALLAKRLFIYMETIVQLNVQLIQKLIKILPHLHVDYAHQHAKNVYYYPN